MTQGPVDAIEALLPAYALNALDDEDREIVERALEKEPRYRRQLADYLATVAQLSTLHPLVSPGPTVWRRIAAATTAATGDHVPATHGGVAVQQERGRRLRLSPLWSMAAVLTLAVGALSGFAVHQQQTLDSVRAELEGLTAELEETERRLVAQQALTYWVAQPGIEAVTMRPERSNPVVPSSAGPSPLAPRGMLMQAPNGETVLLVLNLAHLPEYYSYQAWVWDWSGRVHSLGVFETDANGFAQVLVDFPESAARFQLLRVTVEPAGGSTEPSGVPVLSGTLADRRF